MPHYNPAAKCPKCGHDKVETAYYAVLDWLTRICERCGYKWNEDPLDAVEALPAPIPATPALLVEVTNADSTNDNDPF